MPSEAFREMLKDELPQQQPPNPTKKDYIKDFWYYHRFIILAVIVTFAIVGYFIYEINSNVRPDINVAILTEEQYISGEALEALTNDIAQHCEDYNGDGQVVVYLNLYNPIIGEGAETADPNMQMAAVTKLSADLSAMTSTIFLTDNYDESQETYGLFASREDSMSLATSQQEAGSLLNETGLTPLATEFSDEGSYAQYNDFYDSYIITTRVIRDNLSDEELIDYDNSITVYNSIMGLG